MGASVKPETTTRILTGDEWEASLYAPHRVGQDPTKPMPAGRILTGDEWEQASSAGSIKPLTFPAFPKFAADATRRLNPNVGPADRSLPEQMGAGVRNTATALDLAAPGIPMGGGGALNLAAILGRQVVAPAVEHPIMTAALANPVGAVIGGVMAAHTVAKYGWQIAHESQMTPTEREEAQKDPNRVSGEAAAVQAVMLGLGAIAGVRGARSVTDFGGGMVEAGAKGVKDLNLGELPPDVADAAQTANLKALITKHNEAVRQDAAAKVELDRQNAEGATANAIAKAELDRQNTARRVATSAEELRQEEVTRKAALRALTGVQRRPSGVALTPAERQAYDAAQLTGDQAPRAYFETPKGAEVLGTMAGKHGLPETASPYPPETPLDVAWKSGHATSADAHPEGFSMGGALTDNRIPDFTPQKLPRTEVTPGEPLPFGPLAPGEPGYKGPTSLYARLSTDALGTEYRALLERRTTEEPGAQAPLWTPEREAAAVEAIENRRRPDGTLTPADKHRLGVLQAAQGEEYYVGRHTFESAAAERRLTDINKHIAAVEKEFGNRGKNPVDFMQAPAAGGGGSLTPIEGTGETKTRGLALSVERNAVAKDLTDYLGDLPEYRTVNMADQAAQSTDFLNRDPVFARKVALGEEPAPHGILPEAVFRIVENKAIAEGDVATLRDLASGKLTEQATTMGQRIRALGERDPESPVAAMQKIADARERTIGDIPKATAKAMAEIEKQVKKANGSKQDMLNTLAKFIDAMRC